MNKTLLKSVENVIVLLDFIFSNTTSNEEAVKLLNNVPLVVKQNMLVTKFSSENKLIIYNEPELFSDHEHLFVHKSLNEIVQEYRQYFREISYEDLNDLLPSIIDCDIYLNNSTYIEYEERSIECEKAWKLVSSSIENHLNRFKSSVRHNFQPGNC